MFNPLALLNPGRWALYLALCAASYGGYMYWQHHQREIGAAPYIAQLASVKQSLTAQKATAAKLLAAETDKTAATQKQLDYALKDQEKSDERNKQENDRMAHRLAVLAAAGGGRLRDPNAAGCWASGGGAQGASAAAAQAGAGNDAAAGGLLSKPLTSLLLDLTANSDAINAAYDSCRAWAQVASDAMK